jgi:hypothetical protein
VRDLAAAAQVCREWRAAAGAADAAWQRLFLSEFTALKAADFARLSTWRDRYIACQLDTDWHKLRSKARYLDELEDSSALLEKNAAGLLAGLNQMERTLGQRRHELNAQLALLSPSEPGVHMGSKHGKVRAGRRAGVCVKLKGGGVLHLQAEPSPASAPATPTIVCRPTHLHACRRFWRWRRPAETWRACRTSPQTPAPLC